MTDQPPDTPNPDIPTRPWEWNHRETTEDPLMIRGLIALFQGNFTARQAANYFASKANPEPLRAREPTRTWINGRYSGRFRLVGGRRTYRLIYDPVRKTWSVYLVAEGEKKEIAR